MPVYEYLHIIYAFVTYIFLFFSIFLGYTTCDFFFQIVEKLQKYFQYIYWKSLHVSR